MGNGWSTLFTPDGYLDYGDHYSGRLTVVKKSLLKGDKEMEECTKFKVGDRVSYSYHGIGTVTAIHEDGRPYPVDVKWDRSTTGNDVSTFTKDGILVIASIGDDGDDERLTVVNHYQSKEDKEMKECNGFKVGDRVWFNSAERGNILSFSNDGETCIVNCDLDGTNVRTSTSSLEKITEDSTNASHQVKDISEVFDIMTHLMTKEQLVGFFWGNIIKCAYGYGRKGDEAETAEEIKLYAQKLRELKECESK